VDAAAARGHDALDEWLDNLTGEEADLLTVAHVKAWLRAIAARRAPAEAAAARVEALAPAPGTGKTVTPALVDGEPPRGWDKVEGGAS